MCLFLFLIAFWVILGYSYIKKRLSWKTCERNQNLSEEEKEKKCQYGCERYKIFLEK